MDHITYERLNEILKLVRGGELSKRGLAVVVMELESFARHSLLERDRQERAARGVKQSMDERGHLIEVPLDAPPTAKAPWYHKFKDVLDAR
jgi:hypothetical protein